MGRKLKVLTEKKPYFIPLMTSKRSYGYPVKNILITLLRTSLCRNKTSWEMKIFILEILYAVKHSGGMHKNALFKGRSTLVAMVTATACSRPGASFSYKNVAKKE